MFRLGRVRKYSTMARATLIFLFCFLAFHLMIGANSEEWYSVSRIGSTVQDFCLLNSYNQNDNSYCRFKFGQTEVSVVKGKTVYGVKGRNWRVGNDGSCSVQITDPIVADNYGIYTAERLLPNGTLIDTLNTTLYKEMKLKTRTILMSRENEKPELSLRKDEILWICNLEENKGLCQEDSKMICIGKELPSGNCVHSKSALTIRDERQQDDGFKYNVEVTVFKGYLMMSRSFILQDQKKELTLSFLRYNREMSAEKRKEYVDRIYMMGKDEVQKFLPQN